jgi:DNA-binding XRE family transcriptional regulator
MPNSNHNFQDGRHVIAARAMAGLTQEQLAKAAGLHRNSLRRWEGPKPLPRRVWALERIETALKARGVMVQRLPVVCVLLIAPECSK